MKFRFLLSDPIFSRYMSKGGRQLRNNVLDLCFTHGAQKIEAQTEFCSSLLKSYNPLNWEKAVLYNGPDKIFEAVCRKTSDRFYKEPAGKQPWDRGSKSPNTNRYKEVNWLEVARFDYDIWLDCVQFPASGGILPKEFIYFEKKFAKVYEAYSRWVSSDFGISALRKLFYSSKKYSPDFIIQCMEKVVELDKQNIYYLESILETEQGILLRQVKDSEEVLEQSKQMLEAIVDLAGRSNSVNWGSIEDTVDIDRENHEEFSKVKLS